MLLGIIFEEGRICELVRFKNETLEEAKDKLRKYTANENRERETNSFTCQVISIDHLLTLDGLIEKNNGVM